MGITELSKGAWWSILRAASGPAARAGLRRMQSIFLQRHMRDFFGSRSCVVANSTPVVGGAAWQQDQEDRRPGERPCRIAGVDWRTWIRTVSVRLPGRAASGLLKYSANGSAMEPSPHSARRKREAPQQRRRRRRASVGWNKRCADRRPTPSDELFLRWGWGLGIESTHRRAYGRSVNCQWSS